MKKMIQAINRFLHRQQIKRDAIKKDVDRGISMLEEDLTFLVNSGSHYTRRASKLSDKEYGERLDEINRLLRMTLTENIITTHYLEQKGFYRNYQKQRNRVIMEMQKEYFERKKKADEKHPPQVKFVMDKSLRSRRKVAAPEPIKHEPS